MVTNILENLKTVHKKVSVENNPFSTLIVAPWGEDAVVSSSSPAGGSPNTTYGHISWVFKASNANVTLTLHDTHEEVVEEIDAKDMMVEVAAQ